MIDCAIFYVSAKFGMFFFVDVVIMLSGEQDQWPVDFPFQMLLFLMLFDAIPSLKMFQIKQDTCY